MARKTKQTPDLIYRHILGPSPAFDWRRLRDIAGDDRWRRMCELAAIVYRYSVGYDLPLTNEGECAVLWWFANYGSERQNVMRFEARRNLIDEAPGPDDCEGRTFGERLAREMHVVAGPPPDPAQLARSCEVERRRCLDPAARWRLGTWVVDALDQFCHEMLTLAKQAARDSNHQRRHRRHRRRRRTTGGVQCSGRAPSPTPPSPTPSSEPKPDHPPSPTIVPADASTPRLRSVVDQLYRNHVAAWLREHRKWPSRDEDYDHWGVKQSPRVTQSRIDSLRKEHLPKKVLKGGRSANLWKKPEGK